MDDLPANDRVGAEDGARELGPPGTHQPREAHDLAPGDRERDVEEPGRRGIARVALGGEALDPERRLAGACVPRRLNSRSTSRPTIILMMSSIVTSATSAEPTSRPSLSTVSRSHKDFTSSRRWLTKTMPMPLRLQVAADGEQPGHLALGEGRGRLVHDDELGRDRQRLGDLDHLLLGDRKIGDQPVGVEIEPDPFGDRHRLAPHPGPVHQPETQRLAADEDVLGHGQGGDQVELLVDRDDPALLRVERARELDALALELDPALVRRLGTRQDLQERRLAGTVLAQKRMDLARCHREVDTVDGEHAGKGLPDAGHAQERRRSAPMHESRPTRAHPMGRRRSCRPYSQLIWGVSSVRRAARPRRCCPR
jgi:hypothetical protein